MQVPIGRRVIHPAVLLSVAALLGILAVSIPMTKPKPVVQGPPDRNKPAPSATESEPAIQLWVPAYFYPIGPGLGEWEHLIASARSVPIVAIVNPASGPGRHADPNLAAVLPRARAAGIRLVGYISTQYGRKPIDQVRRECETFLTFYPDIRGFHFDEQSSRAEDLAYYAELYQYIHDRIAHGLVLTNPGTLCDRVYAERPASDVISLFENEGGLERFRPPAWMGAFPGSRFCVQAHGVGGAAEMRRALDRASKLRIGYVFLTDDVLPNPYDRLPTYWDEEVAAVRERNQAAARR